MRLLLSFGSRSQLIEGGVIGRPGTGFFLISGCGLLSSGKSNIAVERQKKGTSDGYSLVPFACSLLLWVFISSYALPILHVSAA